jgi:hypothetical protein
MLSTARLTPSFRQFAKVAPQISTVRRIQMVKRTFLSLSVFLGSLAGVFLCNGTVRSEQDSASVMTSSPCESWGCEYQGCWYDEANDHCPYHMHETATTPAADEEQVAEKPCDAPVADESKYDGYEAKYYGYQWEYDDYDSAYEDYGWSEPIAESPAETVMETEVIETETTTIATVDDDSSEQMNYDDWYEYYDDWSEYDDDEYRYLEATNQATQEAATEVCTDSDQPLDETVQQDQAVEAAIDAGCFDLPADEASMNGYDPYEDDYGYGYDYGYEYGYEYDEEYREAYEHEPKFDRTEEVVDVTDESIETETIEVAEENVETETVEAAEETVEAEMIEAAEETVEAEMTEAAEETTEAETTSEAASDNSEAWSDEYDYYHGCYYGDCDYGYGDYESSLSTESPTESESEETTDGEVNDLPVLRQAAILTLARSLDQMGSALQMLSRQLTEMATPEVAARDTMTVTDQH